MTDPKKTTLINLILDRTGSMSAVREQVIAGFNEYLASLQKDDSDVCLFSMAQFDFNGDRDRILEVLCTGAPVAGVKPLTSATYLPRGTTPLYDAIGQMLHRVDGSGIAYDRTIFVIMTDGLENASLEYDKKKIHDLIEEKEKTGRWTFVFLGADQNAWAEASKFAPQSSSMVQSARSYRREETRSTFAMAASATASYRAGAQSHTKDFWGGDRTPQPDQQLPPAPNPFSPTQQKPGDPEPPKNPNPYSPSYDKGGSA